jgi:hypothetical protein
MELLTPVRCRSPWYVAQSWLAVAGLVAGLEGMGAGGLLAEEPNDAVDGAAGLATVGAESCEPDVHPAASATSSAHAATPVLPINQG